MSSRGAPEGLRPAWRDRAVVLTACGYFVGRAAIDRAPGEARGTAGALHAVWELTRGGLCLAAVVGGLIVFGAYGLLEAPAFGQAAVQTDGTTGGPIPGHRLN